MPYFPEKQEPEPYKCKGCRRRFIPSNTFCTVMHGPGSCCHQYEIEVGSKTSRRFGMLKSITSVPVTKLLSHASVGSAFTVTVNGGTFTSPDALMTMVNHHVAEAIRENPAEFTPKF